MVDNTGEIQVYNTAKQEAEQIVFPILKRHVDEVRQARTGEIPGISIWDIEQNKKKSNRVKSLHLMISSQKDLIQVALPYALRPSLNDWERKYKEEEKIKNPFDKEHNDYNKLEKMRDFLDFLDEEIVLADKSRTKDDDFLIESQGVDGMESELTQNFHEMLRELEKNHVKIISILIKYRLVSAGISDDESETYKELEEEGKKRIVDA